MRTCGNGACFSHLLGSAHTAARGVATSWGGAPCRYPQRAAWVPGGVKCFDSTGHVPGSVAGVGALFRLCLDGERRGSHVRPHRAGRGGGWGGVRGSPGQGRGHGHPLHLHGCEHGWALRPAWPPVTSNSVQHLQRGADVDHFTATAVSSGFSKGLAGGPVGQRGATRACFQAADLPRVHPCRGAGFLRVLHAHRLAAARCGGYSSGCPRRPG
mmetsp:Transcript_22397/g.54493  ORF Transcript_22397/g.54493 Transcript_22397/m.54493 type:complete len:213 (-) Transcript_22397:147-785(-)